VATDARICLVSPEPSAWGGIGNATRQLARTLAARHEVTVVHSGVAGTDFRPQPIPGVREEIADKEALGTVAFSCESHHRSAAALAAIERAYGSDGPDYLEVSDFCGHGLVSLRARRAGRRVLDGTLVGVKLSGAAELIALHDGFASVETRFASAMEREQLRLADRTIWRGGDALDLYRRYYADLELPEPVLIRPPLPLETPATADVPDPGGANRPLGPGTSGGPLRILFVGRLQRVKGAIDLVDACLGLPDDEWELTMIGADTLTAPLGGSVRETIDALSGEDPRIRIEGPLPHDELQGRWGSHDLLVVPSTFDAWPNVAIEAMGAGLPILATPVGGLAEMVEHGVTGWHAEGLGAEPLRRALAGLLGEREAIERVRASGAIGERLRRLTDPEQTLAAYARMLDGAAPAPRRAARPPEAAPHVTVVIPYFRASNYVEEAVASALAQTHEPLDVLIVNDGSFEPEDGVLARLAASPRVTVVTQLNRGETAARNLGIRLARGEYVAMLDADNAFEPRFVERALDAFRREPDLAYVTSWLTYVEEDGTPMTGLSAYAPLGNSVLPDDSANWDGDAIAVMPRELFVELGYGFDEGALAADWALYRRLREDGRFGAVIPESLARYRVRASSLTKSHDEATHARDWAEAGMRRALRATRWTAEASG
jgi:glycosyltransferase involved in cell wall biosynthesis/GT2 family glycosyltransferase